MDEKLKNYVDQQAAAGVGKDVLYGQLISAGWKKEAVDQVLNAATIVTAPSQPVPQPIKKANPPIAAQVLYALGIVGLILGMLTSIMMFDATNDREFGLALAFLGVSKATAVIFGIIVIALFVLINYIRARKMWALISYTSLIMLGFLSTLFNYVSASQLERYLKGNDLSDFLPYIIVLPLLAVLWTRNRKEFS